MSAHQVGLGEREGELQFSDNKGAMNLVLTADKSDFASVEVPVLRLDTLLAGRVPALMKLDVEGYEYATVGREVA